MKCAFKTVRRVTMKCCHFRTRRNPGALVLLLTGVCLAGGQSAGPIATTMANPSPTPVNPPGMVTSPHPVIRARTPVGIPDIPGFVTLKCDFHMHTVFSDGLVWPSVRAEEAWREGLDAIAITDHLEYQPHKEDVSTNHNRAYEIARGTGDALDLLVIRGSEITRQMPPGHLNAIFLTNSASLAVTNWRDAITVAHQQDAFIFWNHPGWDAQTTNGLVLWYPEHTELLNAGILHGIEVVNGRDYYPEAHAWAIEKNLAMLSNSDIHDPLNLDYQVHQGDHRPLTLVFAKERTLESLKQALFARRTAVYSGNWLIGSEQFLRPIFTRSVAVKNPSFSLKAKQRALVQIHNHSEVDYLLKAAGTLPEVSFAQDVRLPAGKTVLLPVTGKTTTEKGKKKISLPYTVANLLVRPNEPLPVTLDLDIALIP
ncbi:MAG TPA: Sb-PDE family phosphodiesterase [Candidatus Paceibacterota bacterium]|nr:Sb-PDE family phosphodiesterase [Candidatus Paceibacterota bacterium]